MNHVSSSTTKPRSASRSRASSAKRATSSPPPPPQPKPSTLLRDAAYDVVLLDIWLPDRDGLDTLTEIRQMDARQRPRGRHHQRPRHDRSRRARHQTRRLRLPRKAALARPHPHRPQERHEGPPDARGQPGVRPPARARERVTGKSVPMKALRQQIKLMAPTNGRVLIYGESGTGKELIGRAMHAESLRKDRVFRRTQLRRHPRGLHRVRTLRLPPRSRPAGASGPPKSAAPSSAPTAAPSSSTKSAT